MLEPPSIAADCGRVGVPLPIQILLAHIFYALPPAAAAATRTSLTVAVRGALIVSIAERPPFANYAYW